MTNDIQKASMLKRASADIFDSILMIIIAVGVAFLLSSVFKYDDNTAERDRLRKSYEAEYGVSFDIAQEDYEKLTDEEKQLHDSAYSAFATDPEVNRIDTLIINLSLLITVFSTLSAFIVFELVVPMLFGNGQTLGKKIFGIGVMRVDGVKISTFQLFVRSILGKYTLETMIPIFLILLLLFGVMELACLMGLGILMIMQAGLIVFTRLNTPIHDMISGTVAVDFASQMIFNSSEEMMEYKKKIHEEAASKAEY